jgi:alkanesulfonate monooxygenase SsuD/methylene tetrahydromethanopterin reductase-like flavin-dependent oxidoreductase (luciferase family)
MQYGIVITTGDPRTIADDAAAAEAAGWDGVFTWDAIAIDGMTCWDPWVLLAGMAAATSRVTLGAMVFAPSRRRPWKLAREALTIDHLSGGRLVLPVGLGALEDRGFGGVGETTEARGRAELLDEALAIIDGLWRGEPFSFEGRHHHVAELTLLPRPVQRPRIPIWVVGAWPAERSMARAARWDGLVPQPLSSGSAPHPWGPEQLADAVAWIRDHRPADLGAQPYTITSEGRTPADDPAAAAAIVRPWAEAGATWWIEADWTADATRDTQRRRIEAGPPRI